MKADKMIEKLIKKTVYVVDPLPEKVPKKSRGQYFEVEYFWHESGEAEKICRKFERIILKLNCYEEPFTEENAELDTKMCLRQKRLHEHPFKRRRSHDYFKRRRYHIERLQSG